MMATKEVTIAPPEKNLECCMCGDYGLSDELYHCKICQFRSQHRYCSNLYPKAESYRVCNWCLDQTDRQNSTDKGSKSSSNSSSVKIEDLDMDDDNDNNNNNNNDNNIGRRLRSSCGQKQKPSLVHLKIKNAAMRDQRQKSLDIDHHQRSPTVRKRIITKGELEERLRRTKSEEMSSTAATANKVGITRNVFRNKVRRYKLLDEVSS